MRELFHVMLKLLAFGLIVHADDMRRSEIEKFRQEVLSRHNILRAHHGSPELKLNPQLNIIAKQLALAYSRMTEYEKPTYKQTTLGINRVNVQGNTHFNGRDFTNYLYAKEKNFDYTSGSMQNAKLFTQLVWKGSTDMGVGLVKIENALYIVALYYPPGNVVGDVINNVLPPIENKSSFSLRQKKTTKSSFNLIRSTKNKKLNTNINTNLSEENGEFDLRNPNYESETSPESIPSDDIEDRKLSKLTAKTSHHRTISDEIQIIHNSISEDFYSKL